MNIKGQNKQPQSRPESAASAPKTASFAARKADVDTLKQDDKASYPFGKINFICMGVCPLLAFLGFLFMAFAIIITPGKCPFGRCRNKNA